MQIARKNVISWLSLNNKQTRWPEWLQLDSNPTARLELNHLASLAKWLSVCLRTKWFWVRVQFSHLKFRFRACFEQEVPWHSGNYRVSIHCETRTWHDKNTQSRWPESTFFFWKIWKIYYEALRRDKKSQDGW